MTTDPRVVAAGRWGGVGLLLCALLCIPGCGSGGGGGEDWDGLTNLAVTSPLLRQLSQEVSVSCRIDPDRAGEVTAVTADLSQIGGPVAQPLTEGPEGTWSWSGRLVPTQNGIRRVTFRAATADQQVHSAGTEVRVNDPDDGGGGGGGGGGDNLPPEVSNEVATTTGIGNLRGPATISCTAIDTDGEVVSVEADLRALNGPRHAAMTHGDGDTWSWTGDLTPTEGEHAVPIVATDDDGATGTGEATATVGPPFELTIAGGDQTFDVLGTPPLTLSASIAPAPPGGAEVTYHWSVQAVVDATIVAASELLDGAGDPHETLDTDENSVAWRPKPVPWHWLLRVPMRTTVACHATIHLPLGDANTSGDSIHVTITQQGLEVTCVVRETVETRIDGVIQKKAEAGFIWPRGDHGGWFVAFLDPMPDESAWSDHWNTTVSGAGTSIFAGDGDVGVGLESTSWNSDGGISHNVYLQHRQRLESQYAGLRAKVSPRD